MSVRRACMIHVLLCLTPVAASHLGGQRHWRRRSRGLRLIWTSCHGRLMDQFLKLVIYGRVQLFLCWTRCLHLQRLGHRMFWLSQVVATRPSRETVCQDLPVVPFMLKRARREPLDEDIRRLALQKFRDLVLQDPLATQLGTSLRGRFDGGSLHEDIDQSFRDAFRMKASSTLQKRASSMTRLAKLSQGGWAVVPIAVVRA